MATPYASVIDLALVTIRDYNIDKLYALSPADFETYMEGFLIKALPSFDNCVKDLSDRNETSKQFNQTLNDTEIKILAEYLTIEWLTSEINDIKQIRAMLQNGKEAHRYSEANLLKEKVNLKSTHLENINNLKTSYDFKETDWGAWVNGDYGI